MGRITADLEQVRQALRAGEARLQSEQTRAALTRERAELIPRAFNAGELDLPDALRALAAVSQAQGDVDRQLAGLGLAAAHRVSAHPR